MTDPYACIKINVTGHRQKCRSMRPSANNLEHFHISYIRTRRKRNLGTNVNGEDNNSYQDCISCVIGRKLMAKMPCNKNTKDNDWDDD